MPELGVFSSKERFFGQGVVRANGLLFLATSLGCHLSLAATGRKNAMIGEIGKIGL